MPTYTPELVEAELGLAGATLLVLHVTGCWPAGYRSPMPEIVRDWRDAEDRAYLLSARDDAPARGPAPLPSEVSRMDQVLRWIALVPPGQRVLRRIVGLRALSRWRGDELLPILPWRAVAERVGASARAVRLWPGQALGAASGGPVGPSRRAVELMAAAAARSERARAAQRASSAQRPPRARPPGGRRGLRSRRRSIWVIVPDGRQLAGSTLRRGTRMRVFRLDHKAEPLLLGSTSVPPTDDHRLEVGGRALHLPDVPGAHGEVGWVYRVHTVHREDLRGRRTSERGIVLQPGEPTEWLPDFRPNDEVGEVPEDLGGG